MAFRAFAAVLASAVLAGCVSLPEPSSGGRAAISASAQWRERVGGEICVAEVLLTNNSAEPVTVVGAQVGACALAMPGGYSRKHDGDVPLWWRLRPGATIAPGRKAVLTIAFRRAPQGETPLTIDTAADTFSCDIPRYRFLSKKIAAMATAGSGELALLLDAGGVRPVSVAVNGEECPFERFVDGRLGRPEALVAHSGRAVRMGGHVVAEVVFADGTSRFACAKAMAAPCIEMPGATAKVAKSAASPRGLPTTR